MTQLHFKIFLILLLLLLLSYDFLSLAKRARRAWQFMALVYGFAILIAFFPTPIIRLSQLLEIGRPVDLLMYVLFLVVIRELIINRFRHLRNEEKFVSLIREVAVDGRIEFPRNRK